MVISTCLLPNLPGAGICLLFSTGRFWCLSHSANYKARRQFVREIFQNFQEAHVCNNSSTGTCYNRFASYFCEHRIYNNLLEARNLLSFLYVAIAVSSLVCSSALTEADDTSSALSSEKLYSETADTKLQKFGVSLVQHIFSSKKTENFHSRQDWYGELSGGQRSKAELMRQIFLQERCPKVGRQIRWKSPGTEEYQL